MGFNIFSKLVVLSIICIICVVPIVSSHDSKRYPAIFNFGDSNSDTGNFEFSGIADPQVLPNGQTYFKKPTGRASDGRLIIDFLTGIPYLTPYLNSIGAPSFINGTNFAVSGCTIDNFYAGVYTPFHLLIQINQFLRLKDKAQELHAKSTIYDPYIPHQEHFAKALYMFDIGQNDLSGVIYLKQDLLARLPRFMSKYEAAITALYEQGARNFWIHNTGPLGCLPEKIVSNGNSTELDEYGCVAAYNEYARTFNQQLYDLIKKLQSRYSDANFVYVDIFSIKLNLIISRYSYYGFEKNLMACCGYGGPPYNYIDNNYWCGQTVNVNGTKITVKSCDDSSKYISWDGVHYTEAANSFVASEILSGKYSTTFSNDAKV